MNGSKLNLLDRVIGAISPQMALSRVKARAAIAQMQSRDARRAKLEAFVEQMVAGGYSGAQRDRLTQSWHTPSLSADQLLRYDHRILTDRARALIRDDSIADSIAQAHRRNLANITPKAAAYDPKTRKPLKEFNRALDELWDHWAHRAKFVDIERTKTFVEMQGLAAEEFCAAGQAMAIHSYEPRADVPGLVLQMIEPEQIARDRDNFVRRTEGENEIRNGIEIDAYGAPVAYWIHRQRHPLEGWTMEVERIPADRVIRMIRQRRVRQTIGVTRLASGIRKLLDLGKYDEAELIAAWMEACIGFIDEGDDADESLGFDGGDGDTEVEGGESTGGTGASQKKKKPSEIEMSPGYIARGKYKPFQPQHPGKQYSAFVDTQLRRIAVGTGFAFSTISGDFTKGSYAAQRQEVNAEEKEVEPLQELVVDTGIGQPVWDLFTTYAVLENRLPVDAGDFFANPRAYLRANWQPPARPPIDMAREAAAQKIAIDYRLTNRRDLQNRTGGHWLENFDQIEVERNEAEARGITLPEDALGGPAASPREPKVRGTGNGSGRADVGDRLTESLVDAVLREVL